MALRAALADPQLACMVGTKDRSDWFGAENYAAAGNDVFDYNGQSYAGLEGWQFTVAHLQDATTSNDMGQIRALPQQAATLPLPKTPFGTHTLLAMEGPVLHQSSSTPDAFVVWGNGAGGRPSIALAGDAIMDGRSVYVMSGVAFGVVVSQSFWLNSTVRTTILFMRTALDAPINQSAFLQLSVTAGTYRHPRSQAARLPVMPAPWDIFLTRALKGYRRYCEPYRPPHDDMSGLANSLTLFRENTTACTDWRKALDLAATADEFRIALAHWAPKAGFGGTPYKQIRRMAEAYLKELDNKTRANEATAWWNEYRWELAPSA